MKLLAEFDLDIFPPSVNHMHHSPRAGFRYDTAEYKQFKQDFAAMVGDKLKPLAAYDGLPLGLSVAFHWSGWHTKDGKIRKGRDVSNRYKAIEDAVFKAIGIDDSLNCVVHCYKREPVAGRDKFIKCEIYQLEE
jgi:Holliday junction resolvase RusA-like endonuclease